MTGTIYTQEPGKYHVQKTVGGWIVVYITDRHNARNVDGGKVHKNRQNAYAKAKRLNDPLARKDKITGFWLSQMWSSEDFGRVTAENLYNVIQQYSDHPDKKMITVEDCAIAMWRRAQASIPPDWTAEDQATLDAQFAKQAAFLAELRAIDEE